MGESRSSASIADRFQRVISAIHEWSRKDTVEVVSRWQRLALLNLRVALLVARPEVYQRVRLHAQALALKTLLAVIPLLAVVFAVFKGFGGLDSVQLEIEKLLVDNLTGSAEVRGMVHEHMTRLLGNVEARALGPVSVVILVFSVLSLLNHVEDSVNTIFGVTTRRSIVLRFVMYWAILTLGPLVLGASLTLTTALQVDYVQDIVRSLPGGSQLLLATTPLVMTWLGFTAFYLVVPHIRVRLRSAFQAALVAGTAWNVLKFGYAYYASHAVTVQNIYGSLAAIPLFMLWIWLSWLLVLYGAQLTFAYENATTFFQNDDTKSANLASQELAYARVFLEIARDFAFGAGPTQIRELAQRLGLSRRLVDQIVEGLSVSALVNRVESGGLVPARELASITMEDVLCSCRRDQGDDLDPPDDAAGRYVTELLAELADQHRATLDRVDFRTLAYRFPLDPNPAAVVGSERPNERHTEQSA